MAAESVAELVPEDDAAGQGLTCQTLSELCEHLDMTRQAVTQHLTLLEEANLVATTWRGREKLHFLNPVPRQEIYERWISKFERSRLRAMRDLKRRLEGTPRNGPEPR